MRCNKCGESLQSHLRDIYRRGLVHFSWWLLHCLKVFFPFCCYFFFRVWQLPFFVSYQLSTWSTSSSALIVSQSRDTQDFKCTHNSFLSSFLIRSIAPLIIYVSLRSSRNQGQYTVFYCCCWICLKPVTWNWLSQLGSNLLHSFSETTMAV